MEGHKGERGLEENRERVMRVCVCGWVVCSFTPKKKTNKPQFTFMIGNSTANYLPPVITFTH